MAKVTYQDITGAIQNFDVDGSPESIEHLLASTRSPFDTRHSPRRSPLPADDEAASSKVALNYTDQPGYLGDKLDPRGSIEVAGSQMRLKGDGATPRGLGFYTSDGASRSWKTLADIDPSAVNGPVVAAGSRVVGGNTPFSLLALRDVEDREHSFADGTVLRQRVFHTVKVAFSKLGRAVSVSPGDDVVLDDSPGGAFLEDVERHMPFDVSYEKLEGSIRLRVRKGHVFASSPGFLSSLTFVEGTFKLLDDTPTSYVRPGALFEADNYICVALHYNDSASADRRLFFAPSGWSLVIADEDELQNLVDPGTGRVLLIPIAYVSADDDGIPTGFFQWLRGDLYIPPPSPPLGREVELGSTGVEANTDEWEWGDSEDDEESGERVFTYPTFVPYRVFLELSTGYFYAYTRKQTFDTLGRLVKVSGEVRTLIDATVPELP